MACTLSLILIGLVSLMAGCGKKAIKPPVEVIHTSTLGEPLLSNNKAMLNQELENNFTLAAQHFKLSQYVTQPRAIIVPHAEYQLSGLCAATAYQALFEHSSNSKQIKNSNIKRVILLSPSHSTFYHGIALPHYTAYQTALGRIPVDITAITKLKTHYLFKQNVPAHTQEHGIEMQLPLLQKTVADFQLIPLIVGKLSGDAALIAADMLASIIDETTLVVVSSDLTHHGKQYDYQPFAQDFARNSTRLDSLAVQALCVPSGYAFQTFLDETHATICGQDALKILLHLLEGQVLGAVDAEVTSYYTSAQMQAARPEEQPLTIKTLFAQPADKNATDFVGYAGIIYRENSTEIKSPTPLLNGYEEQALLSLARDSIENYVAPTKLPESLIYPIITPGIEQSCGLFASLKMIDDDRLRGCIGTIEAKRPLYKAVHDMAIGAAFGDQRFLPLAPGEAQHTRIEIAMLSPVVPVAGPQEIILGTHGIILKKHNQRGDCIGSALFLPNVARELKWSLEDTLAELSQRAGLAPEAWKRNSAFFVFQTNEIKE
jgi:AmmeMemoRadiSam system protein B/AmmeMemoRadiSam system protein A